MEHTHAYMHMHTQRIHTYTDTLTHAHTEHQSVFSRQTELMRCVFLLGTGHTITEAEKSPAGGRDRHGEVEQTASLSPKP